MGLFYLMTNVFIDRERPPAHQPLASIQQHCPFIKLGPLSDLPLVQVHHTGLQLEPLTNRVKHEPPFLAFPILSLSWCLLE